MASIKLEDGSRQQYTRRLWVSGRASFALRRRRRSRPPSFPCERAAIAVVLAVAHPFPRPQTQTKTKNAHK